MSVKSLRRYALVPNLLADKFVQNFAQVAKYLARDPDRDPDNED